jgi:hypothetical protein
VRFLGIHSAIYALYLGIALAAVFIIIARSTGIEPDGAEGVVNAINYFSSPQNQ